MTLPEMLGGAVGAIVASVGAYRAVIAKIDNVVGKKDAPGDGSLRDLVMRIDGKIDAQHANATERFDVLDRRLDRVEARVFTPPERPAMRVAAGGKSD